MEKNDSSKVIELMLLGGVALGLGACAIELRNANHLRAVELDALKSIQEQVGAGAEAICNSIHDSMLGMEEI